MGVREPSAKYLIRAGYKQTELGVVPESWEIDRLDRFWSVLDCKHVTASFIATGYPVASIKEVQSRFVDLTGANQTSQKFYSLLIEGGRRPRDGDLLLSRNATVGETAQVAGWHPPFAMGQDVCLLRKKSPELSTGFLQGVFRSPIIGKQLSDLVVGSTFKRANVQQIRSLTVSMPPSAEQEAIAAALSDADALIESLEQLLAKKRQIRRGAMQELLRPRETWQTEPLGKLFSISAGSWKRASLHGAGRYVIMDMGSVSSSGKTIKSKRTDSAQDLLAHGDLVMPKDDIGGGWIIGKVAYIDDNDCYVLGDHVYRLQPLRTHINSHFFHFLINSSYISGPLSKKVAGSAQLGLGRKSVLEQASTFPIDVGEQSAIAGILAEIGAEIEAVEIRLKKARQLRQGMMQVLLTGEIRLPLDVEK